MNRRQALLSLGSGALTLSAGCLGVLTGTEPLTFEAGRATVSPATLGETGYEEDDVTSETVTRSFSAAGQSREVEVTNRIATYDRSIDFGPLGTQEIAVFAVLSTPQVRVLDRTFNPVGEMSNRELLQELQARYDGLTIGASVGTSSASVLGEAVEIEQFQATATYQGQEIDLFVHITTVAHEGDYVVPVAVYPRQLPDEEQRVLQLY
ncbi:MAG: DUF6517 family protein, partial [Halobacteriales archaeon]|nr:DUF6517 family protein [Halobacteriales archaeon]